MEAEWGLAVVVGAAAAAETAADEFDAAALGRIAFCRALAERRDDVEGCAVASTTSDDGDDVTRRVAIAEAEGEMTEKKEENSPVQAGRGDEGCERKNHSLNAFSFESERIEKKHPPLFSLPPPLSLTFSEP